MDNSVSKFLFFVLLVSFFGCAGTYVPSPSSIDPDIIPVFSESQSLKLINTQTSSEIIKIGSAGMGRSLEGNLQQWTDKAIELTTRTLSKKGVIVDNNSQKILNLAITKAAMESAAGGFGFICTVNLNVDTGNNQHFEFVGQKVYWKYAGSCDKAFTEVVSVMLADEFVQRYIGE